MKPESANARTVFTSPVDAQREQDASGSAPSNLDRVIEATLARMADLGKSSNYAALLSVARDHRNQLLELDPVGVGLVQAALGTEFRSSLGNEQVWQEMTGSIAASFFADATAHARLVSLWNTLCEAVRD